MFKIFYLHFLAISLSFCWLKYWKYSIDINFSKNKLEEISWRIHIQLYDTGTWNKKANNRNEQLIISNDSFQAVYFSRYQYTPEILPEWKCNDAYLFNVFCPEDFLIWIHTSISIRINIRPTAFNIHIQTQWSCSWKIRKGFFKSGLVNPSDDSKNPLICFIGVIIFHIYTCPFQTKIE